MTEVKPEVKTEPLPLAISAEEIFAESDLEIVPIEVKEWKRTIHIRVLPADEGLDLSNRMNALKEDDRAESMFMLLAATLVSADGKRYFTSEEHMKKLRGRSQKVLMRLQKEALKVQGWEELKKEAAKNV